MLTLNLNLYHELHPEVPFHDVIDIIRGQADQDYLDAIMKIGKEQIEGEDGAKTKRVQIIYLDRNNTPCQWKNIAESI